MKTGLIIISIILCILAAAESQWSAPDNILINCGSTGNTSDPWRTNNWLGDNSKYSPTGHSQTSQAPSPQPNVQPLPYLTARLSRSPFTYSIPLTRPSGPVFIRLYFFPAPYPTFDSSPAFFSVHAGPYTLLSNFSASLNANASGLPTVLREFCVVVSCKTLNLTFTPSEDYPDSYAFINGIEVVSMPDYLYYSDKVTGVKMVDDTYEQQFFLNPDRALEMAYRISAGSITFGPNQDTGMSRVWEADNEYLINDLSSVSPVNTTMELSFTAIPNYTAPVEVYQTARTMGINKTTNYAYNLTWKFTVDSGFTYLVRLHFCEFQNEINEEHDREFTIYIAGMTAEPRADVITWGGKGVPVYRDYVVVMGATSSKSGAGGNKKLGLTIAMHPRAQWRTKYSDAILNGLEIFKISNGLSLAGPNPDPPLSIAPPPASPDVHQKSNWVLIMSVTAAGIATLSLLFFLIFRRPGAKHSRSSHGGGAKYWNPFSVSTDKSSTTKGGSSLPSDLCRHFSLADIRTATNSFDKVFIIGVGGFGNVFKGFIDGEQGAQVPVAIKRLNPGSQQGAHEFMTEIEMLSRLRHLNLVSLIGYCEEDGEMILVYDYMSRGTLRDHLYDTDNQPLPWDQRLKICIGAASGLQYLHTGAKHPVIHRDVKSTNILLDDKWVAKVSDFGLSRTGATDLSNTHVTTMVKGSLGYLDPEYRRRQHLTEKSDVYSFGVVLFEVLCGRPALNRTAERNQVSLAEWARHCYEKGTVDEIVDQNLKGKIAPECLKKYTEVAVKCLHDNGAERPSMSDVAWDLKFVLEMQYTADKRNMAHIGSNGGDLVMNFDEISYGSDSKSSGITMGSNSSDQSFSVKNSDTLPLVISNTVFSEINNPIGR